MNNAKRSTPHGRQRGVALITALLMVALVTIIAAGLVTRMNVAAHRSGNLWQDEQAWWYVIGVENWIAQLLQLEAENSDIDALNEAWAQPVDYLPIEGGALQGRVVDLQARFNVNNLANANTATLEQFQRLIEIVTETDAVTAATIAQATKDWVDGDQEPTLPYGAEDGFYLGQNPAYRAANQAMANISELRLVSGITNEFYLALEPHVTALPSTTALNVNTATPANLAALAPGISPAAAQTLAEKRLETPWESVRDFAQEDSLAGMEIPEQGLSVATGYFQVNGLISVDRGVLRFSSVFARAGNGITRMISHNRNLN